MQHWYRLAVDIDPPGVVKGASYEVHTEDSVVEFGTVALPPGVSPWEALTTVLDHVTGRYGVALTLPLF